MGKCAGDFNKAFVCAGVVRTSSIHDQILYLGEVLLVIKDEVYLPFEALVALPDEGCQGS